jgi:hypothetical protein
LATVGQNGRRILRRLRQDRHSVKLAAMSVTAIPSVPSDLLVAPENFVERICNPIFKELVATVNDWGAVAGPMRLYPWKHFIGHPNPAELRKHKATLESLIAFGELLNITTSSPAFPDKEIAVYVTATLGMLRDDLAMWHSHILTDAEAEALMQKIFPE